MLERLRFSASSEYTSLMSTPQSQSEKRIEKLEENAGYADRHIELLSSELAQINQAMTLLNRRFTIIESRLSELNDRVGGEDAGQVPPPHSAGPDIPRDPL